MSDGIMVTLEDAALRTVLDGLGASAEPFINDASRETAVAIVGEAKARLARQLGPHATGATVDAITTQAAANGHGFVVISSREAIPKLPVWLEHGTVTAEARHYFYVSAEMEAGAHYRRIGEAIQAAIDAQGIGS